MKSIKNIVAALVCSGMFASLASAAVVTCSNDVVKVTMTSVGTEILSNDYIAEIEYADGFTETLFDSLGFSFGMITADGCLSEKKYHFNSFLRNFGAKLEFYETKNYIGHICTGEFKENFMLPKYTDDHMYSKLTTLKIQTFKAGVHLDLDEHLMCEESF